MQQLYQNRQTCFRCAAIVPDSAISNPFSSAGCATCRETQFHFESVISLGPYREIWRDSILRIKNSSEEILASELGKLLGLRWLQSNTTAQIDVIVPISSYWRSRLQKGSNVAETIAEGVGQISKVRVVPKLLVSTRQTKKQGTLATSMRRKNVRGAFMVSEQFKIDGARILLVDDVLTSGATCSEAARICKRQGAKSITVAVIARGTGV